MTERRRRRHPARNTRIAALGLSATTMLGLTAALGVDATASADDPTPVGEQAAVAAPLVEAPPPLGDVRHSTLLIARPTHSAGVVAEPTPVITARPAPTAAPRPAPRPAPVARSNGSR